MPNVLGIIILIRSDVQNEAKSVRCFKCVVDGYLSIERQQRPPPASAEDMRCVGLVMVGIPRLTSTNDAAALGGRRRRAASKAVKRKIRKIEGLAGVSASKNLRLACRWGGEAEAIISRGQAAFE
jgi:hypothetical protein